MIGRVASAALAMLLAGAALADGSGECAFPEPGRWVLNAGQTATPAGPGGGPESREFTLIVEDCGETLLTRGFGAEATGVEKRLRRKDGGAYVFETVLGGFPISVTMEMVSPRQMIGEWRMGGFAAAPGVADHLGPATLAEANPLCGCAPFRRRLSDAVASAEFWRSVYSDPRFIRRPAGLDPAVEWVQPVQERLIDLVTDQARPAPYAEAVRDFARLAEAAPEAGSDAEAAPERRPAGAADAVAFTDGRTCEVTLLEKATGCGAEILNGAVLAHENHHRATCEPHRRAAVATALEADPAPDYLDVIRDPAANARNEVEAYSVEIAHVRDAWTAMCGTPLE